MGVTMNDGYLPPPAAPVPEVKGDWFSKINEWVISRVAGEPIPYPLRMPVLPPGVLPEGRTVAFDDASATSVNVASLLSYAQANGCVTGFPGYPYLSQLLQRSEYYEPPAVIAGQLTRKWVKIVSNGEPGASTKDRIKRLTELCHEWGIRSMMRHYANVAGQFGRAQIFIAVKGQETARDLPLKGADGKWILRKGQLERFRVVEPMWTSPSVYSSIDPTGPDFYKPRMWYMNGIQVHSDRLITCVPKPVPDILKPAYNFGGLSITQLIEPNVRNWLETRDSVNKIIQNFSILVWSTNMESVLQGGDGGVLQQRVKFFQKMRSNQGVLLLDKSDEEFAEHHATLSGLDQLQAQAQEHMAAPTHIPLVFMTGITPAGLNANSDGEIRVFYDWIASEFAAHYERPLLDILELLQLNEWGTIDPSITVEFQPLYEIDAVQAAQIRKTDADTAQVYITAGVFDPQEARDKLNSDPESGYNNLQGEAPGLPELDDDEEDSQSDSG